MAKTQVLNLKGDNVKELALKYLDCDVEVKKDLQGYDRYVIIKNK